MTLEHFPGGHIYEDTIFTIDENGEEVQMPISAIGELKQEPYHRGDAMIVRFDDKGDNDE